MPVNPGLHGGAVLYALTDPKASAQVGLGTLLQHRALYCSMKVAVVRTESFQGMLVYLAVCWCSGVSIECQCLGLVRKGFLW